jgi:hypothetical protein
VYAAVETFFKTIQAELIWRRTWETRRLAFERQVALMSNQRGLITR